MGLVFFLCLIFPVVCNFDETSLQSVSSYSLLVHANVFVVMTCGLRLASFFDLVLLFLPKKMGADLSFLLLMD